ncbi:MAG: hypothetical protein EB149_06615 [Thaumarchaeota archaeon]|nr:hypothetical protein [Nitrososphaerota archaeon]
MSEDFFSVIKLEKYDTKNIVDKHINGSLTLIWRDYDEIIKPHPKMVYVTSVFPNEVKGPHIHTRRTSYFTFSDGCTILSSDRLLQSTNIFAVSKSPEETTNSKFRCCVTIFAISWNFFKNPTMKSINSTCTRRPRLIPSYSTSV